MSPPVISVVIPTFGRPALACAAAKSALAQSVLGDFEVIVVDDGGQDDTKAAIEALGDPRLRYLWIAHAGPAAARNAGVRVAQAPLIAFLDSDTLAQPGWLAAGLARLQAEPQLFGVEGKVERDQQYAPTPFTEAVENLNGGRWLTCNVFLRKAEFLALGGFDERFNEPCREDSEFAFRAQAAGHALAFVPEALVRHPVREVAPSRQFHHAREGRFEALIERQHPAAYRRHFKALDGRQVPLYYFGHYAAFLFLPLSLRLSLAVLALGVATLLYAWCRKRQVSAKDPWRLLWPALSVPYLRLYWVLRGYERYPAAPDEPPKAAPAGSGYSIAPLLAVLFVLTLYFVSRAPFYLQPLMGEEGIFAYLLAYAPQGPAHGLMGRIAGEDLLEPLRHPAGMYEAYNLLGSALRHLSRWLRHAVEPTDIWARLAHSCFQAGLWAALAWRFSGVRGRTLVLLGLLLAVGLSSPLGVSSSIYLQTDTSSGLLLAGLLTFAFLASPTVLAPALALFALGAIGKQEWSIAAVLGIGLGELWAAQAHWRKRSLFLGAALGLGHLFSLAYDPQNYLGGLGVLGSVSPGHQALAGGQGPAWSSLWPVRAPFVLSLLLLLLPATLFAARAREAQRYPQRLACAIAWMLFLPFLASTWNNSPRYFAPAWGAALVCLAFQAAQWRPSARVLGFLGLGALLAVALQASFLFSVISRGQSLTEHPFAPVAAVQDADFVRALSIKDGCVARLSSGYAWAQPVDFVLSSLSEEDALHRATAHGRNLCPEPSRP